MESPFSHEAACHPEWLSVLHGSLETYLCWQGGFILSFRLRLPDNTLGGSQLHTDAGITTCWSLSACQAAIPFFLIEFHSIPKLRAESLISSSKVNCKIFWMSTWIPGWQNDTGRQVLLSRIIGTERGNRIEGTIKNKINTHGNIMV